MQIRVKDIINSNFLVVEDAVVLRVEIIKLLNSYENIVLDFSDIENQEDILTCSFFSTLIIPIHSLFEERIKVANLINNRNYNKVLLGSAFVKVLDE